MQHFLDDLIKNAHACERRSIEIINNKRRNIQNIFIDILSFITRKKITGAKTCFVWKFVMGNVDIFSPFGSHLKYRA